MIVKFNLQLFADSEENAAGEDTSTVDATNEATESEISDNDNQKEGTPEKSTPKRSFKS